MLADTPMPDAAALDPQLSQGAGQSQPQEQTQPRGDLTKLPIFNGQDRDRDDDDDDGDGDGADNDPNEKRRKLNLLKCEQCRTARKKVQCTSDF